MRSYYCLVLAVFLSLPVQAAESPNLEGLVEPNQLVEFSSQVPGIIEQLNVERGDRVSKGQVLATLKSGVEQAAVNLARARVDFGLRKAERNAELYKKKLISSHEKDEIETEIQLAQLELMVTQERLKLRTILSTTDGVVLERTGAPGEYVGEDPFLTIARINPLNIEVVVPIEYYGTIKKGQYAQVVLEEPVGGSYRAQVVIVDQVLDAASGTFGVRLRLPNSQMELPAGLKCQVTF